MELSSVLLVCILVTCSVWTVHGRTFVINFDDQEAVDVEVAMMSGKLPGLCWACKWALDKVKKAIGPNGTTERIKEKMITVCNEIGLLKSICRKFVKKHLGELIEEISTTDDVRTICVRTRACKSKDLSDLLFYPRDNDSQTKKFP